MPATLAPAPAVQTAVAGTGQTTVVAASGDAKVYRDIVSIIITTANAAAGTLTLKDGTRTVAVFNYPNAAVAPSSQLIMSFCDIPIQQLVANAAWSITASANASGYNVTMQYVERQ